MTVKHLKRLQTAVTLIACMLLIAPGIWISSHPTLTGNPAIFLLVLSLMVIGVFASIAVPTLVRLGMPVPFEDITTIERFLAARGETLSGARKIFVGPTAGPGFQQRWRCYLLVCTTGDGRENVRRVAVSENPMTGAEMIKERSGGTWMPRIAA